MVITTMKQDIMTLSYFLYGSKQIEISTFKQMGGNGQRDI